jgi:hypothetical protein
MVTGFQLVDTSTSPNDTITTFVPPIIDLNEFPTCELSVIAVTESLPMGCVQGAIRCVTMALGTDNRTEYFPPYTLYSDVGSIIRDKKPPIGYQTLKACAYSDRACTQDASCIEIEVQVLDCVPPTVSPVVSPVVVTAPSPAAVAVPSSSPVVLANVTCTNNVTGFQLVDASTRPELLIDFVPPFIDLNTFPKCEISVIAVTASTPLGCTDNTIACVRMDLGRSRRFEYFVPYTMYSDVPNGPIADRKPRLGVQTMRACAYTNSECTADETCLEYEVEVLDC